MVAVVDVLVSGQVRRSVQHFAVKKAPKGGS